MAWAIPADVVAVTGATVTEAEILKATHELEVLTGLIMSVERADLIDRDKHWLKLAVAYQATWMQDHPDLFSRADVTSAAQDGESAGFRNVDAHLLAPLARKSIRRLSWRGLRAVRPGGATPPRESRDADTLDDALPWSSL